MSSRSLGGITNCENCAVGCGLLHVYENKLQEMHLIIPYSSVFARHMNEMLGSDNASLKMHLNTMQYYSVTLHYPHPFV